MTDFISGEKLQLISGIHVGTLRDFTINPYTKYKMEVLIVEKLGNNGSLIVTGKCNNPEIIYCHGHCIEYLSTKIYSMNHPFVLITHNSDYNITDNKFTRMIVECPNLIKWYGQNVGVSHEKIHFLPIGIANRMWEHGNPAIFENMRHVEKTENVFMNFMIQTNRDKRTICYDAMVAKNVPVLPRVSPAENINIMKRYKFCICPDGNGFDTHRLWEAFYVKCVPILLRTPFSEIVKKQSGLPMILLDSWDDFDFDSLPDYNTFNFDSPYLSLEFFKKMISGDSHF
jgi:hypothetical protein